MAKLGLLFSGQGAQYPKMGLDYENSDIYLKLIENMTGLNLRHVIETGENLNETEFTQLAVFFHSMLAYDQFKSLKPLYSGVSGFSLGEYSALTASNVFKLEDAIRLVYNRAQFMQKVAKSQSGVMAAVLGLSPEIVTESLQKVQSGLMVAANYNSPVQTVISGEYKALEEASIILKEKGAKRILQLSVSGAFHSPLMREAGEKLKDYLTDLETYKPSNDIYMNVTGEKLKLEHLKTLMVDQVSKPVQFIKTIENMIEDGYTHFLEIGPGQVLSNLVKKIDDSIEVFNFDRFESFEILKGWLNTHGFIK